MFNTLVKRTVTYAVKTGSKCGTTVPRAVIARNASNRKRVAIDGNEAAAHSIYQVSDAAMLFPITPSSGMGEHCDNWANKGLKNVFGQTVTISEMQVGSLSLLGVMSSLRLVPLVPCMELSQEDCWVPLSPLLRV
jgi:pyruvate synthase